MKIRLLIKYKEAGYLIIFLLFAVSHIAFGQKDKGKFVVVGFYNVENLFYPTDEPHKYDKAFTSEGAYHYTSNIYNKKLHNLAFVISKIGTEKTQDGFALLGLAEVENSRVLQDLIAQPELIKRHLRFVHFESPDARGIDVALIYNPEYFKVIRARALPVLLVEDKKKHATRDVLFVVGLLDKDTVQILVNHWPSRIGGVKASNWEREKAAQVCKTQMNKLIAQNSNSKIILMGDLNDNPNSSSISRILKAVGEQKSVKSGELFNPWLAFYKKGLGTECYHNHWNMFDQILLSPIFIDSTTKGWKYEQAEIFNKPFLITHFGKYKGYPYRSFSGTRWIDGFSDHFPVLVYFKK